MTQSTAALAIEVMLARGSVRKYQKGVEMPQADLEEILTLAAKAPSSWNLQHWRYLVISSPEQKQKLLPIAYNQEQVVDACVTVAVLGDLEANKTGHQIYGEALKEGHITQQIHDTMISQIDGAYTNNPQFARDEAIMNASLSAMQLMLAAKAKGYDTCPMGGFNRQALIEEFNIPARYVPVMLISVGKAEAPARPTNRLPLDQLVIQDRF
ncbi:NAD(P)H nitroreductase [Thermoactinomyces vulgaris]|jgi:nitroreductase|nr:NAD(P)H nitroreductase [Thermoactinomyces vulgaris]